MGDRAKNRYSHGQISRVRRPRRDASRSYDLLSRWYDLITGADQSVTRQGLSWFALQPGELVLDLGCGTGSALRDLARGTGGKVRLLGCDLSAGMLARAKSTLSRAGARAGLLRADAAQLPLPESTFDALLLSFTLELFDTPEIPLVLGECRRILKPGGRLLLISLAKTEHPGLVERIYEGLHVHLERFADCRPIYTHQFTQQAGFHTRRSVRDTIWGLPVDMLLVERPTEEGG